MGKHRSRVNFVLSNLPFTDGNRLTENSGPMFGKGRKTFAFQRRCGTLLLGLLLWAGYLGVAAPMASASSGTLIFTPSSLNFGTVVVGSSKTLAVAIANTGTTAVTFSSESLVANHYVVSGFLPLSLAAGKTVAISIRFTPEAAGSTGGYIRFESNASNSQVEYQLTGIGATSGGYLTATPSTGNLGSVPVGTTDSQVIQLKNTGSAALSISSTTLSGSAEFKHCTLAYPLQLAAGQTANCTILFTASSTGGVSGSLAFSSNATNKTLIVPLTGQGIAATRTLTASPVSLSFGNVVEGKSETLAVILKNMGNSSVVVSGITTSTGVLTVSGGVQGATIAAGQSATLDVVYSPTRAGALSGTLSVASDATGSPTKIAVTGDAVTATSHKVHLSWKASTSTGIAGYNVYRTTLPSGGETKLNASIISGTSFSDTKVTAGDTYSYRVTAVNEQGEESAPSASVSAAIP